MLKDSLGFPKGPLGLRKEPLGLPKDSFLEFLRSP